jgi:hypothetical protein
VALTCLRHGNKDNSRLHKLTGDAHDRIKDITANMNYKDAVLGASGNNKLPISFFKYNAARLRDTAIMMARSRRPLRQEHDRHQGRAYH